MKNLVTRVKSYSLSRSVETNSDTNTKYIHYGDIHTHVADKIEKGTKLPNIVPGVYETLNKGDLVLADASEDYQGIATPAIVMDQTDYSLVAGLHTIALRPTKINSLYLYYLIKSPTFRKYGYKIGTGMKVFGISVNRLLEFKTLMPITEEQSKIAELLLLMDKTITLHQRKLEQLEKLKQALLQQMFPQKDENVPRLRFANFAGDWEQRKLGDSLKVLDGDRGINYPHESDFFQSGDTLFLNTGNVTKNGFNFNTVKYITKEKDELLRAGRLEENDFVLTSRGTLGNIGFYDHKIYKDYPKVRINSAMLILRNVDKQLSYSYLHSVLKGKLISDFMKKNQVGSAQPHITKTEFLKLNLSIPENIKEQNKIGSIFNNFDKNITLHHHKFNQLKLLKKELLQQMFI